MTGGGRRRRGSCFQYVWQDLLDLGAGPTYYRGAFRSENETWMFFRNGCNCVGPAAAVRPPAAVLPRGTPAIWFRGEPGQGRAEPGWGCGASGR